MGSTIFAAEIYRIHSMVSRLRGEINLQSLLDTTPPKRVPVLWDGPAPAPSNLKLTIRSSTRLKYPLCRMGSPRSYFYDHPSRIPKLLGCGGNMLYWALVFLVVALVAGVLGFTGIAVAAAGIAKLLFVVFLILFLISLITHFARGSAVR